MRHPNPPPPPRRPLLRMRDSRDRGEEQSRPRPRVGVPPAAEALVRSVPTVGGDEGEKRAGAVLSSTAIAIGDRSL